MSGSLSASADSRMYKNTFPDYEHGNSDIVTIKDDGQAVFTDDFLKRLQEALDKLMHFLQKKNESFGLKGYSVYVGKSGRELLNLMLFKRTHNNNLLKNTKLWVDYNVSHTPAFNNNSFLNGKGGPICVAASMCAQMETWPDMERYSKISSLFSALPTQPSSASMDDDVLYGRAGHLYSLLYLKKYLHTYCVSGEFDGYVKKVVDAIILSGQNLANTMNARTPLLFKWHEKEYVGAAHGYGGILYMLLQARDYLTLEQLTNIVKPAVDYVLSLQLPSGNFPSSCPNLRDVLVQWCHGAPGLVYLFALAYKIFKDEKYLRAALQCGDVTWERGLLKKGFGLCHGVAGNAYTFLTLFNLTGDPKQLHRGGKFAEWCFDWVNRDFIPDRPYSLYEGIAGIAYLFADMLEPTEALFPGFEL